MYAYCRLVAAVFLFALVSFPVIAQVRNEPERVERTTPEPDWQGVRICNRSNSDVMAAKALSPNLHDSSGQTLYISEGWWRINRGECRVMYPGPIRWRYYLLYAEEVNGSGSWGGDVWICVSREPFTIRETQCPSGFNRRRFAVVDTGDVVDRYTWNLRP